MSAIPAITIPFITSADTRSLDELRADLKKAEDALKSMAATDARWNQQAGEVVALRMRINELNATTRNAADAATRAAGNTRNMGQTLLNLSRGAQDAQYGLAGLVNNLEGIAASLGLGAGVAGVVTLLAVVVQQVGPHVVEWFKSLDAERKKQEELKTRLSETAKTIFGEWTPATDAAAASSKKFTTSIDAEKTSLNEMEQTLRTGLGLLKERQAIEDSAGKNKAEREIDKIKGLGLDPDEEQRRIAAVKINALNEDKHRKEAALDAESNAAGIKADATGKAADAATQRRAKLEAEKQNAVVFGSVNEEIAGTKDKDGNVTKEGALDRVNEAKKILDQTRGLEGMDQNSEAVILAEQGLAREEQRLADLIKEREDAIKANGGSSQFRDVGTIDKELGAAGEHEKATKEASRQAQAEKNAMDASHAAQREKIADDYVTEAGKITGELPNEDPQRVPHDHSGSNPFEKKQYTNPPRRNLYAEELNGNGPERTTRNLYAEEAMQPDAAAPETVGKGGKQALPQNSDIAKAAQEAAQSTAEGNAATVDAFQKMKAENEALKQKLRAMNL